MLAVIAASVLSDDVTTYDVKLGFIPGTKPDVDSGFMTVADAKKRCEQNGQCLAFTFREAPDVQGSVHVYFKQDTTVSESDKSWASFVKRPAGLMDVNFINQLAFPLELCGAAAREAEEASVVEVSVVEVGVWEVGVGEVGEGGGSGGGGGEGGGGD